MDARRHNEYIVECLWPGVTEAAVAALNERARAGATQDVQFLATTLVPNDEVVFCFVKATSRDAVQTFALAADIPFARILDAVRIEACPAC